jgi:hypothetical protein
MSKPIALASGVGTYTQRPGLSSNRLDHLAGIVLARIGGVVKSHVQEVEHQPSNLDKQPRALKN